ncbi:MAG: aromatic amino acid lyase, partial [Alphaproteobacteria bacterium]
DVARGIVLLRLHMALTAVSAVSADLCRFLVDRVNDRMTPWVPGQALGMDGEMIVQSHALTPIIGQGFVMTEDGGRQPAADWLAARAITPYRLQMREGLFLVSGHTASWARLRQVRRDVLDTAALLTMTASASIEGMAAMDQHYAAELEQLMPVPGLAPVLKAIRAYRAGSAIPTSSFQAPISYRTTPMIHGALLAAVAALDGAMAGELHSVDDNPLVLGDQSDGLRLFHAGVFHNQHTANLVDGLAVPLTQLGLLSAHRLHRLLDPAETGLTRQLAARPGMDNGLIILHKAVIGLEPRLKALAAPFTIHTTESSLGHTDVETMIFPAIDRIAEMCSLLRRFALYELYTALAAIDQRQAKPGERIEAIRRIVRRRITPYKGPRQLGHDIDVLEEIAAAADFRCLVLPLEPEPQP